jgi:nicotinamide-nucleotide amidase
MKDASHPSGEWLHHDFPLNTFPNHLGARGAVPSTTSLARNGLDEFAGDGGARNLRIVGRGTVAGLGVTDFDAVGFQRASHGSLEVCHGLHEIHLRAHGRTEADAETLLDDLALKIEEVLGNSAFSFRGETMEEVVGRRLAMTGFTLAVAESCTGGLIAQRLTSVPGSSKYFTEGMVTYSNESKVRQLGVDKKLIREFGAVSQQVARDMARGMLSKFQPCLPEEAEDRLLASARYDHGAMTWSRVARG